MELPRRLALAAAAFAAAASVVLAPPALGQSAPTTPTSAASASPPAGPAPDGFTVVHSWALSPAGSPDPGQPGNRSHLIYDVAPGAEVNDSVTLFNYSNVQLTFRVYAADAFNNEDGHFDLRAGTVEAKDAGSWVTFPQPNITIPANSQATMPVTVRVPATARPGDHAAALLASSEAQGTGPDGKVVTVDRRTGSRMYLRVNGPLRPALSVEQLTTSYGRSLNPVGAPTKVAYRIHNTGNVRLAVGHRVSVAGPFGLAKKIAPRRDLVELLPGESFTTSESFDSVPALGLLFAKVSLYPSAVGGGDVDLDAKSKTAMVFAPPIAVVGLALCAGLALFARRSYRRHGAP